MVDPTSKISSHLPPDQKGIQDIEQQHQPIDKDTSGLNAFEKNLVEKGFTKEQAQKAYENFCQYTNRIINRELQRMNENIKKYYKMSDEY